jgi:hypothetical protein
MKYPTLKRFMELNNYTNKVKALKLLKQIKKNFKEGKTISLPVK